VDLAELPGLLAHSELIARSTARALDAPWAVTFEEEAALAEIARMLNVDNGLSWAALLTQLDGAQRPFAGQVKAPPSRPPSPQPSRPPSHPPPAQRRGPG
jgi:hypothetical protein